MKLIGIIGTGKIGTAIGIRLIRAGFNLLIYDVHIPSTENLKKRGAEVAKSIEQITQSCRTIWILVPHTTLQEIFERICTTAPSGTILIDGGNSYYIESVKRSQAAHEQNLIFLDCGTSGGIHGVENGFCLMIGGLFYAYQQLQKQWEAVATNHGYSYVGPSGSGHYVKMVHNAIEYGLLQAYAEGFALLKEHQETSTQLEQIGQLWSHGSIIRSPLLDFFTNAVNDLEAIEHAKGVLEQGGMAGWALQEAVQKKISTPALQTAITVRSQSTKGYVSFITRLIARVRNLFGGHAW